MSSHVRLENPDFEHRARTDDPHGTVEDAVYGAGWNGDTAHAPSQNAVYDKVNAVDTAVASNTTHRGLTNNPHTVTLEQARVAGNDAGMILMQQVFG